MTLRIFTQSGGLVLERSFSRGAPGGSAGLNEWVWDGKNGIGQTVASGAYIALVEADGTPVMRRRMAAVR